MTEVASADATVIGTVASRPAVTVPNDKSVVPATATEASTAAATVICAVASPATGSTVAEVSYAVAAVVGAVTPPAAVAAGNAMVLISRVAVNATVAPDVSLASNRRETTIIIDVVVVPRASTAVASSAPVASTSAVRSSAAQNASTASVDIFPGTSRDAALMSTSAVATLSAGTSTRALAPGRQESEPASPPLLVEYSAPDEHAGDDISTPSQDSSKTSTYSPTPGVSSTVSAVDRVSTYCL